MKRSLFVTLVSLVSLAALVSPATPAFGDVTVKSTVAGKGLGMSGSTNTTTYIKGNKMRADMVSGDTIRSSVYDLDAQKMYAFDSKKKEADVYDMRQLAAEIAKNVQVDEMKASVKPNGKTKDIAGKSAAGFDMDVTLPATMGGPNGMKMTVNMTGPVWIVKGAPGTDEYTAFYKAAVEKGWFFNDVRSAKAQPGTAKAMAEMYRQLAATGGIPYETEMNIKLGGDGPMAGMLAKMGNVTTTTTVTSIETTPLADDMFAPPAGYKLKEQK